MFPVPSLYDVKLPYKLECFSYALGSLNVPIFIKKIYQTSDFGTLVYEAKFHSHCNSFCFVKISETTTYGVRNLEMTIRFSR